MWGLKLLVLADSENGYTVDFNVYIGKEAAKETFEHGLGYDVVMTLMGPYLDQGYHLYLDNFYTCMQLLTDLFQRRTLQCCRDSQTTEERLPCMLTKCKGLG